MPDTFDNKIIYVEGDATHPIGDGTKFIVHICNTLGKWGAGFVVAVSKRWMKPELEYRKWHAERNFENRNNFGLGMLQLVQVEDDIIVVNVIGQEGVGFSEDFKPPIRYEAVRYALNKLGEALKNKNGYSVHMPRIGCGLAGGKWEEIEKIIQETLCAKGISVTVYDFDPNNK